MIEVNEAKVKKVAVLVGLSPSDVKEILFEETERYNKAKQASTIKEARQAYLAARSGSEAEKLALEKWDSLALEKAKQASTIKEAQEVYKIASSRSKAKKIVLEKLYQLV